MKKCRVCGTQFVPRTISCHFNIFFKNCKYSKETLNVMKKYYEPSYFCRLRLRSRAKGKCYFDMFMTVLMLESFPAMMQHNV